MKTLYLLSLLLVLPAISLFSQDYPVSLKQSIELKAEMKKEEFMLQVAEGSSEIVLHTKGTISDGHVTVRLYNPSGKRECNLGLKASKGGTAKGVLEEAISHPTAGVWKLVIENDGASGSLKINFDQE